MMTEENATLIGKGLARRQQEELFNFTQDPSELILISFCVTQMGTCLNKLENEQQRKLVLKWLIELDEAMSNV